MSLNVSGFRWSPLKERAAVLVAEDDLSDAAIADTLGINRRQLTRWRQHPEFAARVAEHVSALEAAMMRLAIAKKRRRVARLERDWQRMQDLIDARAEEMADVTGGDTGLLVRQTKVVGTGKNVQIIEEYVFDRALIAELRDTEKQAAQELKQWSETVDHGGVVQVEVADARDRLVARLTALTAAHAGPGAASGDPEPTDG